MTSNETDESLIAIVDDEACVRESLSSLIRSAGYETKEYASAEDFLKWGWSEKTACLILDVRMPVMGGLELQSRLAETGQWIPIVFLSARASEEEERRALRRGASDFLRKPVSAEALLDAIDRPIAFISGYATENEQTFSRRPKAPPEANKESSSTAGVRQKE